MGNSFCYPSFPRSAPLISILSSGGLGQAKEDATELQNKSKELKAQIAAKEDEEKALAEQRDAAIIPIGNLVHDSVPISDDEVCAP